MKIVLAPDSFKGSLRSAEVIELVAASIERNWRACDIVRVPIADGGEGTLEALVDAAGGRYVATTAMNACRETVSVRYGVINDDTAVIELATIAGLADMPASLQDPRQTTSRGVGELIRRALEDGYTRLLIGIGGSATNDGGMGLLSALGARFFDGDELLLGCGADLGRVTRIELDSLLPQLRAADIRVICDVTNPLLGTEGASRVYGPQKGASPDMVERLEQGMENYSKVFSRQYGIDIATATGSGAAGGVGAALGCVLGARLCPGIDAVLEAIGFDALLAGADLVVTGEGRLDGQSVRFGKGVAGIARRCRTRNVPLAILVGSLGEGWEGIHEIARCSVMTAVDRPMDVDQAIHDAARLISAAADRMCGFIGLLQPGAAEFQARSAPNAV
ncbi:MAG: glycerate kinase [Alphaproteobacteria bacterium]|nr:glycerate kinase [Alphaproteobacteria bacterium]